MQRELACIIIVVEITFITQGPASTLWICELMRHVAIHCVSKQGERRSGTEFASTSVSISHYDVVSMNEMVCSSVSHIAFRVMVENSHVINHNAI